MNRFERGECMKIWLILVALFVAMIATVILGRQMQNSAQEIASLQRLLNEAKADLASVKVQAEKDLKERDRELENARITLRECADQRQLTVEELTRRALALHAQRLEEERKRGGRSVQGLGAGEPRIEVPAAKEVEPRRPPTNDPTKK